MTKTIVIEKYFFGFCYHRYSYTETVTDENVDCGLPTEGERVKFSVGLQKKREERKVNNGVSRLSKVDSEPNKETK